MTRRFSLLIALTAILFNCSQDVQITPATYSKILTGEESKTWIRVAETYTLADERFTNPIIDPYEGAPVCTQDDLYKFIRERKSLEISEGATKCDPEDPDLIVSTSWDIVNATTSIFVGPTNRFDLLELNEESLVYGREDTLSFIVGDNQTQTLPGFWRFEYIPTGEN